MTRFLAALWTHRQSGPTKRVERKSVQQCRKERPVAGGELRTDVSRLAFQDRDLVA
jgi:hypothetical protein